MVDESYPDRGNTNRRTFLKAGTVAAATASSGCLGALTSGDVVRFGIPQPFTGSFAVIGESVEKAFKMHIDEELGGEIDGREVEYVSRDTGADTDTGISIVREFLQSDDVDFIVGPTSSGVVLAVAPVIERAGSALWINTVGGTSKVISDHCTRYHFRVSYNNWLTSAPLGPYAYDELDAETAYVYYIDYTMGQEHRTFFREAFEEAGGTVVGEVGVPQGTSDFAPFFEEIEGADPDALYMASAGQDAIGFVTQAHSFGLDEDITFLGNDNSFSGDVLGAQGEAALGKYSVGGYSPTLDTERNREFVSSFESRYDLDVNTYACYGYDAAQAAVEAVTENGGTDVDGMIETLRGAELDSPRGYFRFHPESQDVVNDMYVRRVVEGDDRPENEVVDTIERPEPPTWDCNLA